MIGAANEVCRKAEVTEEFEVISVENARGDRLAMEFLRGASSRRLVGEGIVYIATKGMQLQAI